MSDPREHETGPACPECGRPMRWFDADTRVKHVDGCLVCVEIDDRKPSS